MALNEAGWGNGAPAWASWHLDTSSQAQHHARPAGFIKYGRVRTPLGPSLSFWIHLLYYPSQLLSPSALSSWPQTRHSFSILRLLIFGIFNNQGHTQLELSAHNHNPKGVQNNLSFSQTRSNSFIVRERRRGRNEVLQPLSSAGGHFGCRPAGQLLSKSSYSWSHRRHRLQRKAPVSTWN